MLGGMPPPMSAMALAQMAMASSLRWKAKKFSSLSGKAL